MLLFEAVVDLTRLLVTRHWRELRKEGFWPRGGAGCVYCVWIFCFGYEGFCKMVWEKSARVMCQRIGSLSR